MTAKQKHLIAIILGVELGLVLFLGFSSHPVFSAWSSGSPTPSVPTAPHILLPPATVLTAFPSATSSPVLPAPAITEVPRSSNDPLPEPTAPALAFPVNPALLARAYPETFAQTPPIWVHNRTPAAHEIVFFRHAFDVSDMDALSELQIFADTRYEVWLDGQWLGRGPARFSCTLREYDVYPLDTLPPGRHVLAILVQWAPNVRRSESNLPLLQARVQAYTADGPLTLTQTGPDWNVFAPTAWNLSAGPVHNWELIGPMEWLDFRALPQDWGVLNFTDTTWAKATQTSLFTQAIQNPTTATRGCVFRPLPPSFTPAYQPRSIPLLVNVPSLPALIEVGALSPGRLTFQAPFSEEASSYSFQVANPIVFTVEVLSLSATANLTDTVHLNGLPLTWLPAGGNRPGVWVGLLPVEPGIHTLTNQNLNAFPIFNVFTDGLQVAPPMIQPGHPGHRMLLADPVPDHTLVTVLPGPALNLRVEQTPAYLILDVGRVMYGRLSAEVLGPPGTLIDIGWDEKLYQPSNSSGPGRPLPFPGHLHSNWSQVDSWIMDGNSHPLGTLDARVGRYIVINVWGNSPVEIRNLQVIEERYPTTPRGEFVSPDPLLNQIWHVGAVTAQLNMLDAYSDPWRERGQWWGDAYVVDRTNRVAFGDLALLRRGLLYMADGFEEGNPAAFAPSGREVHILDYGMLWVQSLEAYITLTHDEAFLMETYPVLKAFLNHLQAKTNAAGLLNITSAHWSQSTYLDSRATFNRHGQSAAVNAIYYGTLNSAANLADWMGDTPFAQTWRTQAEAVKEQVNAQLYLPEEGRFAATYLYGEFFAPNAYSQAWPLAYGLVPETEIPRVVAALREYVSSEPQKPTVDIYGMNWVLEALARNGYMNEALDLIRLYYGYMLEAGATTWWESFTAPERHETAQSHGWGSSPTWLLTTYLLGGRWTGPDTWEVRPALQGVTNLSGSLPIGEHDLLISWQVTSCSHAEIEIRAPSHTTGELVLPFTDVETLTLNGSDILEDNSPFLSEITVQADGLHIPLAGRPEYRFTVEHPCP